MLFLWIALPVIHLAFAAFTYAWMFAYYQRRYDMLAEQNKSLDRWFCLLAAAFWPWMLPGHILAVSFNCRNSPLGRRYNYGLKWW